MTSDPVQTNEIAETFNELAHDRCCKYKSKGLTASTEVLLGLLTESGLVGKTVLDIGCGTGFFALETLRQGASSCTGVDLANAASTRHLPSDIVVMDKVLCCYPDADALLKTASASSTGLLGFVIPRDEGLMKPAMRIGIGLINLVERVRKTGFRLYLHPLSSLDRLLVDNGFQRSSKARSRFWLVFLYTRAGPSAAAGG